MLITLNIGLKVSDNYLPAGVEELHLQYEYVKQRLEVHLQYKYVEQHLEKAFGKPMQIGLAQSDTEKTVVVAYTNVEDVLKKLFWLAYVLKQDCIAYTIQDDDGTILGVALVGEYAHEWNYGVFNQAYFIQLF